MQVAHREGEKNMYMTVKDHQVVGLHPSCGLDTQPSFVLYHEFVLTSRNYIRTVIEVKPEWLLDFAPSYYDLNDDFPEGETKKELMRILKKKTLKDRTIADGGNDSATGEKPLKKKRKKEKRVIGWCFRW